MSDPLRELDRRLRGGAVGTIASRDAGAWELTLDDEPAGRRVRVRFRDPLEQRVTRGRFEGGGVYGRHPLLRDAAEPAYAIYISERVGDAASLIDEIRSAVNLWSDGWRTADEYLNRETWNEDVAEGATGLLLEAPRSAVEECARGLRRRAVDFSAMPATDAPSGAASALVCGSSFVIARGFLVESVLEP